MKKKMLLVNPKSDDIGNGQFINYLTGNKRALLNVSLPTIAALTPSEFDITIVDEAVEDINFNAHYDIVGFSGFPVQSFRAEELVKKFHKDTLIVCGGPSVSINPERWRSFADVLIIGEAERIWPEFIENYLNGCHKPEYRETERFDLSISPVPDYSGFSTEAINNFLFGIVQTSRGCPYDCEFCNVTNYVGRKMRYKPVDTVLREVEQLYNMGFRFLAIADDNFAAGRVKAKEILTALRDWNRSKKVPVKFITEVSIDTAKDEEFLELAAEAGLFKVFIGIETPNVESLRETNKLHNLKVDTLDYIKKFYQHGIIVACGCIAGFDHDDINIFQQQLDFVMKLGVQTIQVLPLTAGEGTRLKERMIKEGRYIDAYKNNLSGRKFVSPITNLTIVPKLMTMEQLQQGVFWLLWNIYKPENVAKRAKTFFDVFDESPKKNKINMRKSRINKMGIGIIWRIFKYYITRASSEERKSLKLMIRYARRSSHPQRFDIVVHVFFYARIYVEMLTRLNPKIADIEYPEIVKEPLPESV